MNDEVSRVFKFLQFATQSFERLTLTESSLIGFDDSIDTRKIKFLLEAFLGDA
jgi:hypothetical protein